MNQRLCKQCNKPIEISDKFCPHCGTPVSSEEKQAVASGTKSTKTISSSGNYSGTMIKGKGAGTRKIIRNIIIAIVLIGIVALIIWFQVDPEAGKKLTDALMGIGFMIVFFFVGWLFMRGKKGRRGSNYDDPYNDVSDDNDFDDDDDD